MNIFLSSVREPLQSLRSASFRMKALFCFGCVYIIWGTTYLGLRFAVETIPPVFMAGLRNTICGCMFLGVYRLAGKQLRPSKEQWGMALLMGLIMVFLNNGATAIAARMIPSGMMALLLSLIPLIMSMMEWMRPSGKRPAPIVFVSLIIGSIGIGILVEPALYGAGHIRIEGVLLTLLAALCWSSGSMIVKYHPTTADPQLFAGLQMLCGGVMTLIVSIGKGDIDGWSLAMVSAKSAWSFVYLVLFGSYIAYTAYLWLLRNVPPHYATNYAYINPIIAVCIGGWIGGEIITLQTIIASCLIICSVALPMLYRKRV
jgi:drug/metabolite transporter (DMT)-like permease